jgi:hypothetical protein
MNVAHYRHRIVDSNYIRLVTYLGYALLTILLHSLIIALSKLYSRIASCPKSRLNFLIFMCLLS